MFVKYKRSRNKDGTFKKDVKWTFWNEAWSYRMSDGLKDMLERTFWTFVEAFLGALVVAPLYLLMPILFNLPHWQGAGQL